MLYDLDSMWEYGVKVEIEPLKFKAAAWIKGERANLEKLSMTYSSRLVEDHRRRLVVLAEDSWNITYMAKLNPGLTFRQFSEELFVPEK